MNDLGRSGASAPSGYSAEPEPEEVSAVPVSIPNAHLWNEEAALERAARAIAATKRGTWHNCPEIDRVWRTYIGQARAAVAAYNEPQYHTFTGVLPVIFP